MFGIYSPQHLSVNHSKHKIFKLSLRVAMKFLVLVVLIWTGSFVLIGVTKMLLNYGGPKISPSVLSSQIADEQFGPFMKDLVKENRRKQNLAEVNIPRKEIINNKMTVEKIDSMGESAKISIPEEEGVMISEKSDTPKFIGHRVREFPEKLYKFRKHFLEPGQKVASGRKCRKWAVLATTNQPSEASRRFMFMKDWCLVVVAGEETRPETYHIETTAGENIVFLTYEDQTRINSKFVDAMPTGVGRKNIGYLYAIANGAEVIWDFDDENALKFWIEGASPNHHLELDYFANFSSQEPLHCKLPKTNEIAFNPYPNSGASHHSWPRGFPLHLANQKDTYDVDYIGEQISRSKLGILQSLADYNPDFDAVYKMTRGETTVFNRNPQEETLLLPDGVYSPCNAQASLHFKAAFHALYLPTTVSTRVSDIWRGYVAKALMDLTGNRLGFMPRPLVTREAATNNGKHNLIEEYALFEQTSELLKLLNSWKENVTINHEQHPMTFEQIVADVWAKLYERGFIEIEDVTNMQLWLQALARVGYEFPWKHLPETRKGKTSYKPEFHQVKMNFALGHPVAYQPTELDLPDVCSQTNRTLRRFYTADLHFAPRIEVPAILAHLGQKAILGGYLSYRSKYPQLVRRLGANMDLRPSPVFVEHKNHSDHWSQADIARNWEFSRQSRKVRQSDAFFCSFPASMCEVWLPANKSIVFLTVHRYNLGRCDVESWNNLTRNLGRLMQESRHVVGAVSRYDVEYMRYYTGFKDIWFIPSYSGFYTDGNSYSPTREDILLVRHKNGMRYYNHMKELVANVTEFKLSSVWDIYEAYTMADLVQHPAAMILPYAVMTFKIVEIYSLNIPIFIPSARYYRLHGGLGSDRTSTSSPYCMNSSHLNHEVLRHPSVGLHPYSPNTEFHEDPEAEMYWLQYSDYYEWPHVQLFDDAEDFQKKLKEADLQEISRRMKEENEVRRIQHKRQWCRIVSNIPSYGGS